MRDSGITSSARRFRSRRRRFLLVSTAALAAVGIAMGVSFTANTGTASISVTPGTSSTLVYPVASSASLPSTAGDVITWGGGSATAALKFGTKAANQAVDSAAASLFLPAWSPVAGAAGTVPTASGTPGTNYLGPGDLFVIDGRTASAGGANYITINIYITNLSNMQAAYSSFAWPIDLYVQHGTTITTANWNVVDSTHPSAGQTTSGQTVNFTANSFFLTNTGGYLSYYLPTGADLFYEIAMDAGGSYFTVNTGTPSNLGPSFFVTAQPD